MDRMKVLSGHIRSEDVADGKANLDLPSRGCARHYCESYQGSSYIIICRSISSNQAYNADESSPLQIAPTLATPGYDGFQHAQTMASFPPAAHDVFRFDDLLTQDERDIRYRTRAFMVG